MKPLRLTMSAFGSYAGEETLNFAELGTNGLYLITGETGAGKTTVFDAVSYALFGKASGTARNNYKMLRSDYADERTKTFVELDFSSGVKTYRIRREITPHVVRKTGEVTYNESVFLRLADGTVCTRKEEVSEKILDIIGLNHDQFAQIVMIAQNDFLRFLQSGTDKRVEILRRIFGTGLLRTLQEKLKTLAKEKDNERKIIIRDFEKYNINPYDKELFAGLKKQAQDDETAIKLADNKIVETEIAREQQTRKIAVAQETKKLFDDLGVQRQALETHNTKQGEMAVLFKKNQTGEVALRKVKPFADKADEATKAHKTAVTEHENAKSAEQEALSRFEQAKNTLSQLPPLEEAQTAFDQLRREWERVTDRLKALTQITGDYNNITHKQSQLNALKTKLTELKKNINALPSVTETQSALDKLNQELSALAEKHKNLNSLKNDCGTITTKQNRLIKEQAEFETLTERYNAEKAQYDKLYELFLREQAGVLAQSLKSGEPCPVCGSTEHPSPAAVSDGDISKIKLKKLQAELEDTAQKRDTKTANCVELRSEIKTLIERLLNGISSECLAMQTEISTQTDRFLKDIREYIPKANRDTAGNELPNILKKTKSETDELALKKNINESKLAALKTNLETAAKANSDSQAVLSSARALAEERKKREQEQKTLSDTANRAYHEALTANGFAGETDYAASLITESELAETTRLLADYEIKGRQIGHDISRLESETAERQLPDLDSLNAEATDLNKTLGTVRSERDEKKLRFDNTSRILKELKESTKNLEKTEKEYAALKGLADTANGKLDFETYAQTVYFERVLRAANIRLKVMSQNRYAFLRKEESDDGRKRKGLEIEVTDSYTGKSRSANSLSGGESFMASLSLALGLSDVVQQSAGGVRLDAMFIDEGFGYLDAEVLELAVRTLSDIAGGSRIVGIISHITELRERIDKQIHIIKTTSGSKISRKNNGL